ncbi:uncharacterized protein F5147DRAFT_655941 [Suillus discolor]|uniref:Uncharacterized protein n=1 Tax=Suillus discolor TaxID=1912936 RepID=A0A9P7F0A3_9AGAM|nr:uncharacterized protein F5147DRAFT_655941 [Suillus discolor]KAG2098963.1 hypothetical protein F5147DRAFT_655941 [Suillus discolor]
MNSDLCTSPLSTRPEKTLGTPAKEMDSISFDLSKSPNPQCAARRQFMHNRMMRKQRPYPVYPAPIEGLIFILKKHIGYLENGLAQLHSSTLYKGYKAKLAACKTACQCLVCFTAFLDALHTKNEERLGFADKELQSFRKIFSERDCTEVDDDRDYLQAIYEDECKILRVTSAQAEQISKILDSSSDLDSEEECLGAPVGAGEAPDDVTTSTTICMPFQSRRMLCGYLSVPCALIVPLLLESSLHMPVKRAKGKTMILKPTRGSGLNPSHVPADTQMHLSDEQPHEPMANTFNPHEGFSSSTHYDNYNSFSAHAASGYAPSFHPAHTFDTHVVPSTDPAYQSLPNPNHDIPASGYVSSFHPAHTFDTHAGLSSAHVASSSTRPQADASSSAPAESSSADMDYTFPNPDYNIYNNTVPSTDPAYQSLPNPNHDIPPYGPLAFNYESYGSFEVSSYSPRHLEHLSNFDNMQGPNPLKTGGNRRAKAREDNARVGAIYSDEGEGKKTFYM